MKRGKIIKKRNHFKREKKKGEKNKKESLLRGRWGKKPKGNGIKDGFVRLPCVYAVVFWFFIWRWPLRGAALPLAAFLFLKW